MAHLIAVADMAGGLPDIDFGATPVVGYSLIFRVGNFGLYLFGGSNAQLVALNALANVRGLVAMTEDENARWAELDTVIAPGVRAKINAWLTARGYPNIPAGWTYRQVVRALIRRMRAYGDDNDEFADWVLYGTWIKDGP